MKFPHLEKFADLIKDLKYEYQSIVSLWGRVKLNFRYRYGKPNIFSENLSAVKFFQQIVKNDTLASLGASQGQQQIPPMMGGSDRCPSDHKTTLNIDIYPSTLGFFFENIGHKYDFEGGGVVLHRIWGWGVVHIQRKKVNRILIHIYLQSMFRLSF